MATAHATSDDGRKLSASSPKSAVPPGSIPRGVNFVLGGLAGMGAICFTQPLDLVKTRMQLSVQGMAATVFVQPLDLVKNRMQLSGQGGGIREHKTSLHAITSVVRTEGVLGLYNGLSAGLFRQATYSTTRLGIYQSLFDYMSHADGRPPNLITKIGIGVTAGGIGALIGTPAEISLIRMTSDGRLPPEERRGYKNVFDALFRITKEEGIGTLWRGCSPTVARAMVVNAAQLATYFQAKQSLLSTVYFNDNIVCHFAASMISGLVTTVASMPIDIAKTRIQTMKTINGVPEYKGSIDVLTKLIRREGIFSLWKGFTPYYARLGPHTVLTFIFLEQLRLLYYNNFCHDKKSS